MSADRAKLGFTDFLGYGFGQTGNQILRDVPATLLLFYMTNALIIPPAYAGLAILLPKIWVIIADPLVGMLSDRTQGRWGPRKPFLVAGSVLSSASFLLIFTCPTPQSPALGAVVIGALYILLCSGISLYSVPYLTMAADLSNDPKERTKALAFKQFFALVGVLGGLALAPWLISIFDSGLVGYRMIGLILGAIVLSTTLLTALVVPVHQPKTSSAVAGEHVLSRFIDAFRHRPFRIVFIASTLQLFGFGVTSACHLYFVVYVARLPLSTYSMFVLASVAGAALAQPLWVNMSSRVGTLTAYRLATVLYAVAALLYLAMPAGAVTMFILIGFFSGGTTMGFTLMSFAMLIETIALDGPDSSRKGLFAATYTAMEKAMLAVGGFAVAIVLSASGLIEGAAPADQPVGVSIAILLTLVGGPSAAMLLSLLVLARYGKRPNRIAPAERLLQSDHAV